MRLEQLIKLAQSKGYCVTIFAWDDDIGYSISLDTSGCGDEYGEWAQTDLDLRKIINNAAKWLRVKENISEDK